MFTPGDRRALRDALVALALSDANVTAAALVGSSATGLEDEWSDIDLALALAGDAEVTSVAHGWTTVMYGRHGAVHHVDVWRGPTLFRVFLLDSSLQVDLSFWPAGEFRATAPTFRLLFGDAGEPASHSVPTVDHLAGMGLLYALHVRSALARRRPWQAVYMLDAMRDQVIGLACVRHGLPAHEGRGVDRLPRAFTEALRATRAREVEHDDLRRAFLATVRALHDEVARVDTELAARLAGPIRTL